MKIALLGKGKTGGKVLELIHEARLPYTIFDSKHIPSIDKLKGHDVIISFLPGEAFKTYSPLLVETQIPVGSGSTGVTWASGFESDFKEREVKGIDATNVSRGMNVVQQRILIMNKA